MSILACALRMTADDLVLDKIPAWKSWLRKKVFDFTFGLGAFIIPIVAVTTILMNTIPLILSGIFPEFHQLYMNDGGAILITIIFMSFMIALGFDYVFAVFCFNCLECYEREKRRRKTITKKMNDDNNV